MGVVGNHVPRLAHHGEEDALGGAALVRGDHVAEAGKLVGDAFEAEEALAAGVGFVAAHDELLAVGFECGEHAAHDEIGRAHV